METNLDDMMQKITDFIKSEARSETVVGEPFTLGDFHCVPVVRVGLGFGSGVGTGNAAKAGGEGAGGGAGMGIEPIGFLVTRNEEISFIPTVRTKGLSAAFAKVPDLIEKMMKARAEKKGKKEK